MRVFYSSCGLLPLDRMLLVVELDEDAGAI